ncbi:hypothetical protein SAMN05446037_1009121 [Anaerovirgula multivorans]|uniref:Uncharacterized protein n=1 Tax=Anaerovirgula multivorans TaxID=312168 RepID=A0A239EAE1_9FIRM|nr:DUF5673 domain-containing protein [Anaerovirgula multivorans]SNS40864.1 hypothetical protein SAMN05446037_1009121 [Anaerovirgula multivorans]
MKDIGFFEIVILTTLVVLVYFVFKELNRKKYLGEFILQAPRDFDIKASMGFWVILGCFWIIFLIERGVNINQYDYRHPIGTLGPPILWIFICSLNILKCIYDKEMREDGISSKEGFVYWRDIISYRWTVDEELEITFQPRTLFTSKRKITRVWTIYREDQEKVDEIFSYHINTNQERK